MAAKVRYINLDLAKVYREENGTKKFLRGLAWGDAVRVRKETADAVEIDFDGAPAFIPKRKGGEVVVVDRKDSRVLKADFEFLKWKNALKHWKKRGAIAIRRLEIGDHDAFDFLREEDIDVQVLGPIPATVKGKTALRFLGNPPKGPRIGHESLSLDEKGFSGKSASHTINGHSVIFRLTCSSTRTAARRICGRRTRTRSMTTASRRPRACAPERLHRID